MDGLRPALTGGKGTGKQTAGGGGGWAGKAALVLSLLAGEDMYGYQMIVELARRSDHTFEMK